MYRPPTISTSPDTLVPYTTLFRSCGAGSPGCERGLRSFRREGLGASDDALCVLRAGDGRHRGDAARCRRRMGGHLSASRDGEERESKDPEERHDVLKVERIVPAARERLVTIKTDRKRVG